MIQYLTVSMGTQNKVPAIQKIQTRAGINFFLIFAVLVMVQCRRPDGSVCRATAFAPWAKGFFWGLPKKETLTKKSETERERRKRKRGEFSQKTHDLLTGGHSFFLRQEKRLWAGQFTFKTALCFPQIFVAERLLLHTTARADRQ